MNVSFVSTVCFSVHAVCLYPFKLSLLWSVWMYHRTQKLCLMLHPLEPFCIWLLGASSGSIVKLLGVYLGSETLCISGVLLKYFFCVANFFYCWLWTNKQDIFTVIWTMLVILNVMEDVHAIRSHMTHAQL